MKHYILILLTIFGFIACTTKPAQETQLIYSVTEDEPKKSDNDSLKLDIGEVKNGVYHNDYFKLSFDVPPSRHTLSKQDILNQLGEYNNMEGTVKILPDFSKSIILFMSKERNYNKKLDINSSFMVSTSSKNIDYRRLKNEQDYIDYHKSLLRKVMKKEIIGEVSKATISGVEFHKSTVTIPLDTDINLLDIHYVKLIDDLFLDIRLMYCDIEDNDVLFKMFDSIKIE